MIHFYHGLFGSPTDWKSISPAGAPVVRHDLYAESKDQILSLETGPEDVLIGYSMGGRIALEIACRNRFNLRWLLLLSAHPGLLRSERTERATWENKVAHYMETMSLGDFRRFWNSMSIFSSSQTTLSDEATLRKSADLFKSYQLSKMKNRFSDLNRYSDKITWIIGTKDKKYKTLIEERVIPAGVEVVEVETDHRVLKATQDIKTIMGLRGLR